MVNKKQDKRLQDTSQEKLDIEPNRRQEKSLGVEKLRGLRVVELLNRVIVKLGFIHSHRT